MNQEETPKFADLHLHTIYSDGTDTPEEVVLKAEVAGLYAIAIVDHDTVSGIQPALDAASDKRLEIIPGIELTAEHNAMEVHILGYFLDYRDRGLAETLKQLKDNRIERIHKIVARLAKMGIELSADAVFGIAGPGTVGRLHVAQAMVKQGLVASTEEAFRKYIGDKCPANVLGFRLTPQEAVRLIQGTGGIAVLAHPYSFNKDDIITELIRFGIDGLEVYYPEHSPALTKRYEDLAKKYNLLATGGSDCHGQAKPDMQVGAMKIPYALVEQMKARI